MALIQTPDAGTSAVSKPKLTIAQIFTMSFGFLGIQFGFALQNGNTSRILRSFGADVDQLPAFWLVAPVVGMIVQPLIGHYSDHTWNRLGRRKPYFLTGAILSSAALVFLPNSGLLAYVVPALWVGAGMVMIMDASFNVAMEPFRALVADNLPESQRTLGFSIQTFLIGLGAVAGSFLPEFMGNHGFSLATGSNEVADNIKYSFYIGAAVFMVAILITVLFTKEYTPAEYHKYHGTEEEEHKAGVSEILKDFARMPKTMKQLGWVQFFSWFALFSMWVFTSDAVATHIYGLSGDYSKTVQYNEAGNKVSSAFGVYNGVAMVYALLLPVIAGAIGRKATHAVSLLAGGLGLISVYFIKDPEMLKWSMVGVGLAWASILAMPYVILSGSIPPGKLGIYMGIFNFFITLPQIVNGLLGGVIVKHVYGGQPIYAIVFAGVFMILAAVSVMFVNDTGAAKIKAEKASRSSQYKTVALLVACLLSVSLFAQQPEVYPTHWWTGMKNRNLQLMVHQTDVAKGVTKATVHYPGVTVKKIVSPENPNYLFIDLDIAPMAKPGTVNINIGSRSIAYQLQQRRGGNGTRYAQGVTSSDFLYLLMPDRFSNGDPSNDRIAGMRDQSLNRDSIYDRHGGDLQGVINHLDYLQQLGITTLWMTPVLENDMPNRTEHGYAFTNHYKIEPRFGGEKVYKALSDSLHRRGMKLIQDAVYNHVGLQHFTVQDPPMKDWLHQWPSFTKPNYKDQTFFDPHGSRKDLQRQEKGWFTEEMPDLNHSNPYVANFLTQHAIWCTEEFGVDGWRIDTYVYCDQPFMNRLNKALADEFPHITEFGEVWVDGTANQAYFTRNNIATPFKSNATGVTDFQTLFHGIAPDVQYNSGGNNLYQTLSNDLLYNNPMNNVLFLDNHDMTRFLSRVDEDVDKLKLAIAWLLTCRGIPQLYYGTEVLMKGVSNPDGLVRLDFQGGWQGDVQNKFTAEGRTGRENEVHDYTMKLASFRLQSSAIKTGRLMQFAPENNLYVYFRYDASQTIMCIMNTTDDSKPVDFTKYSERTDGFSKAVDVVGGQQFNLSAKSSIPAKTMWVLQLSK